MLTSTFIEFVFAIAWLGSSLALPPLSTSTPTSSTSFRSIPTLPSWATIGVAQIPTVSNPAAVIAQDVCPGYSLSAVNITNRGLVGVLTLAGSACNAYGADYVSLVLNVTYDTSTRLHVQISDSENKQYRIPSSLVSVPTPDAEVDMVDYVFQYHATPFEFWIYRKSDGQILFDTRGTKLVFETQYLEITTSVEENANIYGLGEVIHGLRLGNDLTRTLYANDEGDPIDANIYGSHPVYFQHIYKNPGYSTHAVYLRNTHGMDILLRNKSIQYRVLGGTFDFYLYSGPSPTEVVRQYVSSIGLPTMQQYWTLGFHQCRWGYNNVSAVQSVVERYKEFDIPLETIWTDIDYMYLFRDWTLDPVSFDQKTMAAFLDVLHANQQHYVPIHDAAIYHPNPNNDSDAEDYYTKGHEQGVFLLNPDGSEYIGDVWPGYTVFPDFLADNTQAWWTEAFVNFSKILAFDGIWLDMNEASSFCVGSCGSTSVTQNPVHPPFKLPGEPGNLVTDYPEGFAITNATEAASVSSLIFSETATPTPAGATSLATSSSASMTTASATSTSDPTILNVNYPPYAINHHQFPGDLAAHAVSPNATHADGTLEYDIHNIWGHRETVATYNALLEIFPNKRPFIIGRSTFPGTGTVAGHWGGDNASKWYYMYFSIPQSLIFQFFGIPMVGPDTCGFNGNTDEELCNRWMQLSAFFPFYRNHNVLSAISQEAYVWDSVTKATKAAIHIRYGLLPYWYTLFWQASKLGDPVIRPLFYEFPDEPALAAADRQFLVGPAILVTPVLDQGAVSVDGVFPGDNGTVWYDWYTHRSVTRQYGENVTIEAPLGHIPVYIRGGYILPWQEPGYTTAASRTNPFSLIVALSPSGTARGELYLDDGESIIQESTLIIDFVASNGSLVAAPRGEFVVSQPLQGITIIGVDSQPNSVKFQGNVVDTTYEDGVLNVQGVFGSEGAWAEEWELSWS